MDQAVVDPKEVARQAITIFAPGELPLFESMWSDASRNSADAMLQDRPHGIGVEVPITLVSSFLIPLAVSLCSQTVVKTTEAILAHIRQNNPPLPPTIPVEELARSLATILSSSENKTQPPS